MLAVTAVAQRQRISRFAVPGIPSAVVTKVDHDRVTTVARGTGGGILICHQPATGRGKLGERDGLCGNGQADARPVCLTQRSARQHALEVGDPHPVRHATEGPVAPGAFASPNDVRIWIGLGIGKSAERPIAHDGLHP